VASVDKIEAASIDGMPSAGLACPVQGKRQRWSRRDSGGAR
jgi:hypothetical protein